MREAARRASRVCFLGAIGVAPRNRKRVDNTVHFIIVLFVAGMAG